MRALSHSVRPDFARFITHRFAPKRLLLAGIDGEQVGNQFASLDGEVVFFGADSSTSESNGSGKERFDLVIWLFRPEQTENEDNDYVARLSALADNIVLVPMQGVNVPKRRPLLVEKFCAQGFCPDYSADVADLDPGSICLRRVGKAETLQVPEIEVGFARLNAHLRSVQRTLNTRMSELEAADRHIAKLEDKVLALKETKRQLKQLKQEKQALRKSPERKVGQVLLAPYLLPRRLIRALRHRWQKPGEASRRSAPPNVYQAWFLRHRASAEALSAMRLEAGSFKSQPLISIITPVFNTPVPWLEEAIESVRAQVYEKWELILIDDGSDDRALLEALPALTARDERIVLIRREKSGGISAASNDGLKVARGEWIGLLDHDDFLEPDAVFHAVKVLQKHRDADLIYSDEDKLTEFGFDAPLLKPDWSPDFFLSYNYLCHFTTLRRSLVQELGGFRPQFDGAQDYDLFLRVIERTNRIHHVPRVLYHWRRSAASTSDNIRRKPQALEAGRCAIQEHLDRRGERGHVTVDWRTHAYWVKRELTDAKKVSIIIPARDHIDLLSRCVESITQKTNYPNYEIVVVDNDSESNKAREYFGNLRHRLLQFGGPFNFSALNNFAVDATESAWLVFLNNDVEIIDGDWLTVMAEHVQRPEVGAVGARLLYPDDTVQHAGVVLGVGGIAEHAFRGSPANDPGVCRQLQVTRNYSSVTAACLMTRRDVFLECGGFDEERLPVTFNDVDLCLKMRRAGYLVVYTPFARLYHHESATRRRSAEALETDVIRERWPDLLAHDPYYNPNLSRERADFSLGR